MSKKISKPRRPRKFFIKENGEIAVVSSTYFKDLSRQDALGIGVQTYIELQKTLLSDAQSGNEYESFIGTIKVSDGLERSLVELEKIHPFISQQIYSIGATFRG